MKNMFTSYVQRNAALLLLLHSTSGSVLSEPADPFGNGPTFLSRETDAGLRLAVTAVTTELPPARQDLVHGNLIMLQENGGWCWYQDERSLVDPTSGTLLFASVGNYLGFEGAARDAFIDLTSFHLATGRRTRFSLGCIPTFNEGDDHNVAALWQRPDGRYLAMYKGHNQGAGWNGKPTGSDKTPQSFYRLSVHPHDASTWGPEQAFDWPPNDTTPPINNDVTYSNLLFMAGEGSGQGRLYNISRGPDRTPGFLYSDDLGESWTYGGRLSATDASAQQGQYSNGYFKYRSNGVDRIDFIATEHHPRNFNNSIYHGYIEGGKSYDAAGRVVDDNVFDLIAPPPSQFTQIWKASPVAETSYHHGWTAELERDDEGNLHALFTARYGTAIVDGHVGDGDHRLFYARFDAATASWSTTELAKMGGPLHPSEQDYTGLGAIDPNDPNTIYISTPFDPRDGRALNHHEIFQGTTSDHGASWSWKAITENSTVDNLRPMIPHWPGPERAVLWLRGSYPNQRRYDQSVVGVIEGPSESLGKLHYVDATLDNTRLATGAELVPADDPQAAAADGRWSRGEDFGNGGATLASNETGPEDAPCIRTEVGELPAGTYDLFVFFWADPAEDWRIAAGLSDLELIPLQQDASQHAEADHFLGEVSVVGAEGEVLLYRGYLGRVQAKPGEPLYVFVDDLGGGPSLQTRYDGIGYARVEKLPRPGQ
jgi:hypothetical protein